MTPEDLQAEYDYRFQERLGLLCGTAEPEPWQVRMAQSEAGEAVEKLREDI